MCTGGAPVAPQHCSWSTLSPQEPGASAMSLQWLNRAWPWTGQEPGDDDGVLGGQEEGTTADGDATPL